MIYYLWRHRFRPRVGSALWFREWGKRGLTLVPLVRFAWRTQALKRAGARVGFGTVFSEVTAAGKLSFLQVGQESFIGRVTLQLHASVEIGSRVCINDGVQILTASHEVRDPAWRQIAKSIRVGDYAWIATGAILLPGVTVGRGAVIGAGSVVNKDIPDYAVAVGNPAKVREGIRSRELHYRPTTFLAFQAAWLGSPIP